MPCCTDDRLCDACLERARFATGRQAGAIGQCWAERIAREHPEFRGRESWPDTPDAHAIAARLVSQLATDARLAADLARACLAGAAAWWTDSRPMRYRSPPAEWTLVTAPDERERCMFAGDGVRCERRPRWLLGSLADLDYAYLCVVHFDFVRRPGEQAVELVA